MDFTIITRDIPPDSARYPIHRCTLERDVVVITEIMSTGEEGRVLLMIDPTTKTGPELIDVLTDALGGETN